MISKRTIQRWNKKFREATPSEKRVMIANDVIAFIQAKTIKPENMVYSKPNKGLKQSEDIQCNLDTLKCTCCALGGLVVGMIKYTNEAKVSDLSGETYDDDGNEISVYSRLKKYFSSSQLVLIENVFENWIAVHDWGHWSFNGKFEPKRADEDKIGTLINEVHENQTLFPKNPADRMIAIMENIVRNKGTFKPLQG